MGIGCVVEGVDLCALGVCESTQLFIFQLTPPPIHSLRTFSVGLSAKDFIGRVGQGMVGVNIALQVNNSQLIRSHLFRSSFLAST